MQEKLDIERARELLERMEHPSELEDAQKQELAFLTWAVVQGGVTTLLDELEAARKAVRAAEHMDDPTAAPIPALMKFRKALATYREVVS